VYISVNKIILIQERILPSIDDHILTEPWAWRLLRLGYQLHACLLAWSTDQVHEAFS
jgi:hypothetical protein